MSGLPISDVVKVSVSLTPLAAAVRNLSTLLILGSSPNIIDTTERLRSYSSLDDVVVDFGTDSPEYQDAALWFAQNPSPTTLYIGFFAQTESAGRMLCAPMSAAQQAISNFHIPSTAYHLKITVDGIGLDLVCDFSSASTMLDVAAVMDTALSADADCVWNAAHNRFEFYSHTTGSSSTVSFIGTDSTSGHTDVGSKILGHATDGGRIAVGSDAETALDGVTACAAASNDWYAVTLAPYSALDDGEHDDGEHEYPPIWDEIAAYIEAASPVRIFGATTQNAAAIDPTSTADAGYAFKAAGYSRTLLQYSSSSPYAVASLLAKALGVDFTGNNTAITLKFKTEPSVTPETLTNAQADALNAKNVNVFVNYNNATAIIQQGQMCDGSYIDERTGLDWLAAAVQTGCYNLLYTSPTKVPQTDAGVHLLVNACESVLAQAVADGLLAPGVWDAGGFGALQQGQFLAKGYYIYAQPVAQQSPSDRAARKSPPIQIAAKLAGAVHSVNVLISVNR